VTIQYTPNYHIAYADDQTALKDLGLVTQQVAASLDAAMGKAGYTPPDATTFADLVARQTPTILEAATSGTGASIPASAWTNVPLVSRPLNGAGSSTSDKFTATSAGLYRVTGFVPFIGSIAMVRIAARVSLTTAAGGATTQPMPGSGIGAAPAAVDLTVATPEYYLTLAAGDVLRLDAYQQGASAVNLRATGGGARLTVQQLTKTS